MVQYVVINATEWESRSSGVNHLETRMGCSWKKVFMHAAVKPRNFKICAPTVKSHAGCQIILFPDVMQSMTLPLLFYESGRGKNAILSNLCEIEK